MPQDKRRSISYRSFVTCNDPKGIECGAIRKSKINSHKKLEIDRNQENNNVAKSVEIIKERKNDNIAKELLKGALDLQESLVMLGKLQEASSFMLGLSRKQKQKLEDCTFDGMVNGVKGLRNVVRESLVKQNVMIANPVFEEHYYDHRKMGSPDMMPSTSSSRSSMIYSSSFVHSDSCVSSPAVSVKKKGKELNLILKLMGLESFPLSPRNYMDKEKILEMSKRMYDNDSPRAKRVQFGAQEGVMKQRSVGEIFENIKFKGLVRHKQEYDVFDSENERMPIVVMKPMRYPCLDLDKPFSTKIWNEMGMKPIGSKTSGREIVRNEDVYFREKYEVAGGIDCEQNDKYLRKVASAKGNASENLHSKPLKKKAENKKASVEKVGKLSDQEKFASAKIEKRKDGISTTKNQTLSAQATNSTSMSDHCRKRRTVNERKNRQPALLMEENRIGKGQNKKTKAFNREDNDLRGDSKSVSPIVTDNNVMNQPQIKDYDIGSRIKLLDTPKCISYDLLHHKKIIQHGYNQSARSEITSVSTSEYCSVDQLGETQSPVNEVTLSTTHENGIAVDHNMNRKGTQSLKNSIESPEKTKLNAMLLSNSLFVSHLEERFNVQVYPDFVPCVIDDDQELESSRLLLDCADEILEIKSQQLSQACLPFPPSYITNTGSSLCLDRLLEEVCTGIDDLRGYLRPVTDEFPSDNLYRILDRDLRYKSGVWGVGWRSMYTQDVVEVVVGEIDRFVLNKLIEEVLVDLIL